MCPGTNFEVVLDELKAIPELEKEFSRFKMNLKNSEIVVAFPGAFFFIGEHAVMYGQPALYMPIPLYMLAGIKRSGSSGINVELWQVDPENKLYKRFRWINNERYDLQHYIEEAFRRMSIAPEHNILCTYPNTT